VAAALVRRTREPSAGSRVVAGTARRAADRAPGADRPWRDRGYLLFVLLDVPLGLDDSILNVGLPLWLVHRTRAPHAVVPAFLVLNTVLVVLLQLAVSRRTDGPRRAATTVGWYGVLLAGCCLVLATATGGGPWSASLGMLLAAALVTLAELIRSVCSWELAVSLAPPRAQAAYLGVAGMSHSVQKSLGPLLLTGAVLTAGPAGWLALGAAVCGLGVVQRRAGLRRLAAIRRAAAAGPGAQAPALLQAG
jgi:hypothetical protein